VQSETSQTTLEAFTDIISESRDEEIDVAGKQ
jgi:hypothetical protein